ncbi:MAG: HtaA domain-containing protein [Leucobacter sp.]
MTAQKSVRKRLASALATTTAVLLAASGLALAPSAAFAETTWEPAFTAELADGTPLVSGDKVYKDDVVVLKGTGFDPAANVGGRGAPIPNTLPQGTYAVFGKFAADWRPSQSAASSTRKLGPQKWALAESVLDQVPNVSPTFFQDTIRKQWAPLAADGSFTAELTLADPKDADQVEGSYGLFTYGAGGVSNAAQELELRLDYVNEERPGEPVEPVFEPAVKVYLEDGTTEYAGEELEAGAKLVVKGSGFDPAANVPCGEGGVPIPNSLPQGTFAVFGNFAEKWKPSEGVDSSARVMNSGNRGWALDPAVLDQVPAQFQNAIHNGGYTPLDAEGNFTWNVTLAEPTAELPKDGNWGVYTYAGGASGISNAAQEIYVPIKFKPEAVTPEEPGEVAVGGLQWAFINSWAGYVSGAAAGTITASDGATKGAGNVIGYEQVSHNYNKETQRGNILYHGTVVYKSEAHGFEIAIKDPWVTFTADGATITAEVSTEDTSGTTAMSRIILADLDAGAPSDEKDGVLTWGDVATTIAKPIQPATWNDRYAGNAGAPVTFSLGANSDGTTDPTDPEPEPVETTTTVRFSPTTFKYNVGKTATVTVKADDSKAVPTGKVKLTINGSTYNAALQNGKAQIRVNKLVNVGTRSVKASYTSDSADEFKNSQGRLTVRVTKATPKVSAKLAKSTVKTKQNATVKVAITVPGSLKAKASKLGAEVYVDGKKVRNTTTNSAGKVNVKLPKLKAGKHKVRVKFVGNGNLKAKHSVTRTLTVTK